MVFSRQIFCYLAHGAYFSISMEFPRMGDAFLGGVNSFSDPTGDYGLIRFLVEENFHLLPSSMLSLRRLSKGKNSQ